MTEISTKESKGWWNEDIKMTRNELKNSLRKNSKRQTPANHNDYLFKKQYLQNLIKNSKFDLYKKSSGYLNLSKDANQFYHRYEKVLKTKKSNLIEPMYDVSSKNYILKEKIVSNILYNHHINNNKTSNYHGCFKKYIDS